MNGIHVDNEPSSDEDPLKTKHHGSIVETSSEEKCVPPDRFRCFHRCWIWMCDSTNKRSIIFWTTIIIGLLQLVIKCALLGTFNTLKKTETPPRRTWLIFTSLNLAFLVCNLTIFFIRWLLYGSELTDPCQQLGGYNAFQTNMKSKASKPCRKPGFWSYVGLLFNVVATLFVAVTSVIFSAGTSSYVLSNPKYSHKAGNFVVFDSIDCALTLLYLIFHVVYECMSFAMVSQAFTVLTSILNLLIGILSIWTNQAFRFHSNNFSLSDDDIDDLLLHIRSFQYFGIIIAFCSGIGFVTGLSIGPTNRLSDFGHTVSLLYTVAGSISFIIALVFLVLSCDNVKYFRNFQGSIADILYANIAISAACIILSIAGIIAMLKVRKRPDPDLLVEEYDLQNLRNEQLLVWSGLIDKFNKQASSYPDAASGLEALSLLKAYAANPMPHMNCKVLRVYEGGNKVYDKIKAWDKLDFHEAFDDEEFTLRDYKEKVVNQKADEIRQERDSNPTTLSKNAAKRAMRKAAKKASKKAGNQSSASAVHEQFMVSPEEIQRDIRFRNDLIATEALVLLTCVESYDLLTSYSGTWYGKLAINLIGSKSPLKWTCIRIGLLATHWPFRQATLYTSHTRKPNARAAAICRAIAHYNSQLPRSKRCTMILNPTVAHRGNEEATKSSGWSAVPLPPSHVIDLRPYKNCTIQDYLKKIKYRDQSKAFKRANGEVIETTNFNETNCSKAIELWNNIANKRIADGNNEVLAKPSVEFLRGLGSVSNENGYRSLLFLKVDDKIIASAVLFRLGDTITSDIQGLDHDLARQYNAYFVMMQETISIALKTGMKFIDFGPTTSQPKLAIGCKEITMFGGVSAPLLLSWCIALVSGRVQVDE